MRWTAAALLRPITFVLAIVAAVLVGNRTDSFWYGLLAWFVAMGVGRVRRRASSAAGSTGRSTRRSGPARRPATRSSSTGSGCRRGRTFFVAFIAASLTKSALRGVLPSQRRIWTVPRRQLAPRVDLDELLP